MLFTINELNIMENKYLQAHPVYVENSDMSCILHYREADDDTSYEVREGKNIPVVSEEERGGETRGSQTVRSRT